MANHIYLIQFIYEFPLQDIKYINDKINNLLNNHIFFQKHLLFLYYIIEE